MQTAPPPTRSSTSSSDLYLSDAALANLKHYKYSAIDLSPLSRIVLQPYWSFCARGFPRWMAPNLITLFGLGFILLDFALVLVYMPDLQTEAPSWVYYLLAINIWLYSTFDNCDGKHARATGTSSALGELFDQCVSVFFTNIGLLLFWTLGDS